MDRLAVLREAAVAALPVLAEPVEDLRNFQRAPRGVEAVARAVGEEPARLVLELRVEPLGHVRLLAQHRTTDGGTVDGEVHARLVVRTRAAEGVVLDAIERRLASEQREEAVLEGVAEDLAEVPDRPDIRIARQDLLDREGVVGVDQERDLLRLGPAVELGLADPRQAVEVGLELRALLRELRVADLRRLAVV